MVTVPTQSGVSSFFHLFPYLIFIMKSVLRLFPLLITLFAYTSLSSCKKSSNDCPAPSPVTIKQNGPVIDGWPLNLEAEIQSTGYLYKWTGPNGWEHLYDAYASDAYLQTRPKISFADAGEYKLQLVYNGCVEYEGKVIVEVKSAPAPTCNNTANTSNSSVVGLGDYSFKYLNFSSSIGSYLIEASEGVAGGDHMHFAFLGDEPPLPGTYKTSGYWGLEPGKVGLYITSGAYDFVANLDQTVYVNKVNSKLDVSFCSLRFSNPMNPSKPITVSARIVQ